MSIEIVKWVVFCAAFLLMMSGYTFIVISAVALLLVWRVLDKRLTINQQKSLTDSEAKSPSVITDSDLKS